MLAWCDLFQTVYICIKLNTFISRKNVFSFCLFVSNLSKCIKCSIVLIIDVMAGLWSCSQDANVALLAGSKTICIISSGDWILFLLFLVRSMVAEHKSCDFLDKKKQYIFKTIVRISRMILIERIFN